MKGGDTQKILPFITEGALAMILGVGLGLATRTVAKFLILFITISFVVVQVLAYKGILNVNWGQIGTFLQDSVLNIGDITGDIDPSAIVQNKLPTAGALLIGYFFGLKRG